MINDLHHEVNDAKFTSQLDYPFGKFKLRLL